VPTSTRLVMRAALSTLRECQVGGWIADGLSNKAIAAAGFSVHKAPALSGGRKSSANRFV
jgi:hypothetical protein